MGGEARKLNRRRRHGNTTVVSCVVHGVCERPKRRDLSGYRYVFTKNLVKSSESFWWKQIESESTAMFWPVQNISPKEKAPSFSRLAEMADLKVLKVRGLGGTQKV